MGAARRDGSAGPAMPFLQFRHGWVGRILTVAWCVLLVPAVVMPVLGLSSLYQFDRNVWQPIERIGLFVYEDGDSVRLIPMGSEQRTIGIRQGDLPVAIDGRPVADGGFLDPAVAARIAGPDGTTVRLTTLSPDGLREEHRLVRSWRYADAFYEPAGLTRASAMVLRFALAGLPSVLLVFAAVLLFRQRYRQPAAGLLSFACLIGASGVFGSAAVYDDFGLPWSVQAHQTAAWASLTLALLIFPDGRFVNRWARLTAWLVGPFVLLDLFAGLPWQAHQVMSISFVLGAIGFLLWEFRLLPPGVERQQLRWALFGFAVGMSFAALGVVCNIVLNGDVSTPLRLALMIVSTVSLAMPPLFVTAGLLVSLYKYRLYDAEAVVSRSVAYAMLTVILLGLFAATEKVIELLGEAYLGESLGVLSGVLGTAVAAAMLVPLHHRLTRWAEHRFQKRLIRLRQDLPALVGDLRDMAPAARIAAATLESVARGVRAAHSALLVEDRVIGLRSVAPDEVEAWRAAWQPSPRPGIDADRADPLFPLRLPLEADGHGRVGWLLLGPRPDGSFYGRDERETLLAIADPVARALEIARQREMREAAEHERWQEQARLNAELARALAAINVRLDAVPPPKAPAPAKRKAPRKPRGKGGPVPATS